MTASKGEKMHLTVVTHAYEPVIDQDVEDDEHVKAPSRRVEWNGVSFLAEDIEVWAVADQVVRDGSRAEVVAGWVKVQWTDNTDTRPSATQTANIRQTVLRPLPGGGMGPFYVAVT